MTKNLVCCRMKSCTAPAVLFVFTWPGSKALDTESFGRLILYTKFSTVNCTLVDDKNSEDTVQYSTVDRTNSSTVL